MHNENTQGLAGDWKVQQCAAKTRELCRASRACRYWAAASGDWEIAFDLANSVRCRRDGMRNVDRFDGVLASFDGRGLIRPGVGVVLRYVTVASEGGRDTSPRDRAP